MTAFLFLSALLLTILGYKYPNTFLFWHKGEKTKNKALLFYGIPAGILFMFISSTTPEKPAVVEEKKYTPPKYTPTQPSQPPAPTPEPTNAYSAPTQTYATPKKKRRANSGHQSQYIRGPKGGCYYINGYGKKIYVDHYLCD